MRNDKKIVLCARINEIIRCEKHSGYVRDYEAEDQRREYSNRFFDKELFSYETWYEYKLRITYILQECSFDTIVQYSSEYEDLNVGDDIYIEVNKSHPETVLSVSKQNPEDDNGFLVPFLLFGVLMIIPSLIGCIYTK